VRYRLMATFGGAPFEAGIGPTDGEIVLFAACPPPEELGFEPATGHWRRQLPISGVQAVWESRPIGVFRGERCMVLDELGDRLHIGYMGHDGYRAEQLGYWQVDRGVYELIASRSEVTEITEERPEYPRRRPGTAVGGTVDQAAGTGLAGTTGYGWPEDGDTGQYAVAAGFAHPAASADSAGRRGGYQAGRENDHGITLPPAAQAPLPLEAAALAAATASRRSRQAGRKPAAGAAGGPVGGQAQGGPPARTAGKLATAASANPDADRAARQVPAPASAALAESTTVAPTEPVAGIRKVPAPAPAPVQAMAPAPVPGAGPVMPPAPVVPGTPAVAAAQDIAPAAVSARSWVMAPAAPPLFAPATARLVPAAAARPAADLSPPAAAEPARRRLATERLFAELAGLAGVSADSYSIGEEVEGAFCLVRTTDGFEVFHSSGGNRHELQFFRTEEAACFYLFGLLAADAVRAGALAPVRRQLPPARTTR
jgi:hypothetical protein